MCTLLIAPELGVGLAVDQFLAARKELKQAQDEFPEEESFLTLTHAFYSIMGGFAMTGEPASKLSDAPEGQPNDSLGFIEAKSGNTAIVAVESRTLKPMDGNALGAEEHHLKPKKSSSDNG